MIPKSKHKRTTVHLADKVKNDVYNFYIRDDISYQLPGKKDTVVVKEDDGSKVTYQKRILFYNLRDRDRKRVECEVLGNMSSRVELESKDSTFKFFFIILSFVPQY